MTASIADRLDETWTVRLEVTDANRRVIETLAALSNGRFGTWGLLDHHRDLIPGSTVAAGIYDSDEVPALLPGPRWSTVELLGDHDWTEVVELDLRTGTLRIEMTAVGDEAETRVVAVLFASIARPGLHGLDVHGPVGVVGAGTVLRAPSFSDGTPDRVSISRNGPHDLMVSSDRGWLAAEAEQAITDQGGQRSLTRIAAYDAGATHGPPASRRGPAQTVRAGRVQGFATLLAEHSRRWKDRWGCAAVDLPDRPDLERAVRFAQYHVLASAQDDGESTIGARGLTGTAYRGHVFWDTDVFVLPALSAMAAPLARSALRYRINRLAAARRRASEEGRRGARFAWESAASGREVAPIQGRDLRGHLVPILTGSQEEHIVADVAWSAMNHLAWTGDEALLADGAVDLVVETARYWQSRIERDQDGSGHIRGVIGPDEYHETVDDNAYTNVMARWNLEAAAAVCERLGFGNEDERRAWLETAGAVVDGYEPASGRHEQFRGYFELEPVLVAGIGEPPLPADALLGHDRIQRVQIIKQADVLMLHHLVPEVMPAGSLECDIEYYLPRTAHGSSLSPAITAAVLARAGRPDAALPWFEMAARFDLDDISGTTAGGLHLATMGGLWQAAARGFLGLRPSADTLVVDPRVPAELGTVILRVTWRAAPVRIEASADRFEVSSPTDITLSVPGLGRRRGRRLNAVSDGSGWRTA